MSQVENLTLATTPYKLTEFERVFCEAFHDVAQVRGHTEGAAIIAARRIRHHAPSRLPKGDLGGLVSRTMRKAGVIAYLAFLQSEQQRKFSVENETAIREIERIAFSSILDFVSINEDGQADIDLTRVTAENASAVKSVTKTEKTFTNKDGETETTVVTTLTMHDKNAALDKIARIKSLYADRLDLAIIRPEDVERAINELETKLGRPRTVQGSDGKRRLVSQPRVLEGVTRGSESESGAGTDG